jgi:hypothetical protein
MMENSMSIQKKSYFIFKNIRKIKSYQKKANHNKVGYSNSKFIQEKMFQESIELTEIFKKL